MSDINFNFTEEQKREFNRIIESTKKEYPKFFKDPIEEYRIRVIIANYVLLGDYEFGKQILNKEEIIIEEDNNLNI